jgi:Ca2+-binding EF-hand superfamily protein
MEEFKATFRLFGMKQTEIVKADSIFKVKDVLEEKYNTKEIELSVVASTKNEWC